MYTMPTEVPNNWDLTARQISANLPVILHVKNGQRVTMNETEISTKNT